MRSSNPRVLQVQEEYFERIRQGMDGKVDSVVLYRRIQEVKPSHGTIAVTWTIDHIQ